MRPLTLKQRLLLTRIDRAGPEPFFKYGFDKSMRSLENKGMVEFRTHRGEDAWVITERGRAELHGPLS